MKPGLELRLGQSLAMTPQLQQSIRLLQLSTLELSLEIQQAIENNPLLEFAEEDDFGGTQDGLSEAAETPLEYAAPEDPSTLAGESLLEPTESRQDADEPFEIDTRWEDFYESDGSTAFSAAEQNFDEYDPYATTSSGSESLRDHLLSQIHLTALSARDTAIATALIESIDATGYLVEPLDELLALLEPEWPDLTEAELLAVLHLVQSLDPTGVGARDLNECLSLQLQSLPEDTPHRGTALALCQKNLMPAIAEREYAFVLKQLQIHQADLEAALKLIQTLNPRPGAAVGSTAADFVIPDVIVRHREGAWQVDLNPEIAPKLRVNQTYARMISRSSRGEDANYIRSHLQEARWFIKSLRSRNETLLNVARAIVARQTDFFEQGETGMKPLVLREIAEELSLHESTVSRVTTQKYMLTPRGTLEFKYFFSSHVGTSDGGECSATAIRAMIKKLVSEESPRKPLSDAKIADMLTAQGIDVARRTIAKYREAMGIASSTDRKRLI
ncbi:RNA polymerase factor sigma-54 [Halothiobacillus sp. DCM-1]|uniref:RNA polymerase factor sigma-54 n=1 Tax=Halothiobacillus sp. DCM-1 TaxID=3112558 RepID=UPI003253F05B